MSTDDILILSHLTLGQKVRHMRLAMGLRQVDLASRAGVATEEVIMLEKDRFLYLPESVKVLHVSRIPTIWG